MKADKMKLITKYPLWLLLEYIDYVDRVLLVKDKPLGFLDWAEVFMEPTEYKKINALPIPKGVDLKD